MPIVHSMMPVLLAMCRLGYATYSMINSKTECRNSLSLSPTEPAEVCSWDWYVFHLTDHSQINHRVSPVAP